MTQPVPASTPAPSSLPPFTAVIDGHRLRQLRRQHGLSREHLAWQAGIGITTVARLEHETQPCCRTRTLRPAAAGLP